MKTSIRPYHPADLIWLYHICLKTGASGKDASFMFKDPYVLGHYYAAPYAVLEPELCFILTIENKPAGYILGTRNSKQFAQRCESEWFPLLRQQYTLPDNQDDCMDAIIIRRIHEGNRPKPELSAYPAHLHIDLLPIAQGKGQGKALMNTFVDRLIELQVDGLHLEVGKKNPGAIEFYKRLGFQMIQEYEYSLAFGLSLNRNI